MSAIRSSRRSQRPCRRRCRSVPPARSKHRKMQRSRRLAKRSRSRQKRCRAQEMPIFCSIRPAAFPARRNPMRVTSSCLPSMRRILNHSTGQSLKNSAISFTEVSGKMSSRRSTAISRLRSAMPRRSTVCSKRRTFPTVFIRSRSSLPTMKTGSFTTCSWRRS